MTNGDRLPNNVDDTSSSGMRCRTNLVRNAEDLPFGMLWIRQQRTDKEQAMLSPWPMPHPRNGLQYVNESETNVELNA